MDDQFWMEKALALADKAAQLGEVPVGAVIVKDNSVVGQGWNQPISTNDPSAHAEIMAIRDAAANLNNYRLPDTSLYVTIEPCTMCLGAIIHARIGTVVFGAPEVRAGVLCSHPEHLNSGIFNHGIDWRSGVCETQCSEIIQRFFRQRRQQQKAKQGAS